MLINRDIICEYIKYDGLEKPELCKLINRWKRLLFTKYEAKKGQILAIATSGMSHDHLACIFAGAELGMRLMVLTKPISEETIHATKMALLGPVDITMHQEPGPWIDDLMIKTTKMYSKKICWQSEVQEVTDDSDLIVPYEIYPDDPVSLSSTSGTTGICTPVHKTHKEVYEDAVINFGRLKFSRESVVLQNTNMHHMSAMVTHIIPSLMICEYHYTHPTPLIDVNYEDSITEKLIVGAGLNHIMVPNKLVLDRLVASIRKFKDQIHHNILFVLSGFPMTEEYYQLAKELPIEFISSFGTVELGGFIFNHITKDSTYKQNYLGLFDSVNYKIYFEQDGIYLEGKNVYGKVKLTDTLRVEGEEFYYVGRINEAKLDSEIDTHLRQQVGDFSYVVGKKRYVVIWDREPITFKSPGLFLHKHIDHFVYLRKKDFIIDTKVSNEQLLAYLDARYGESA